MAGKEVQGDGVPSSLAGMSKNQLYDIMCQMKTLIEQNKQQAKQILIQNPALTRALFQAQIMLGMVQSPQSSPAIPTATSQNPQPSAMPNQLPKIQASVPMPGQKTQNQIRKQQLNQPVPSPNPQPQPTSSRPLQPPQQPKGHIGAPSTPMSIPQSSQAPNLTPLQHSSSQPPLLHQPPPMPSQSTQSQQHLSNTGNQYLPLQPPVQPPLPPQPRPQKPGFSHQAQAQMRPNVGSQHPVGPQLHHSQHMFHSGTNPPSGLGPSFPQGQLPPLNQPLPPSVYQAGNPHLGMDFNQIGSSKQIGQVSGPAPFVGQVGPSNQPPRPPPGQLTPELEKALLQQVMSLTPEQMNMLPPDQRNQVVQLQQMLRR